MLLLAVMSEVALHQGFLIDDLAIAFYARERTWADILIYKLGVYPSVLPEWKLAVLWRPADPYRLIRLWAVCLHFANGGMVFLLCRRYFGRNLCLGVAGIFLVSRPGNESVLWATGHLEVQMTACLLASLLLWQRGLEGKGPLWPAVILAVPAVVMKPSALLFPAVLLLAAWENAPDERREKAAALRQCLPWVLGLFAVNALMVVNAYLRPETLEARNVVGSGAAGLRALVPLAASLARQASLVSPLAAVPEPLRLPFAAAVFFGVSWAFWKGSAPVRLGLVWAVSLVSVPVLVRGLAQPRYEYPAAVGTAMVIGAVLKWAGGQGRILRGEIFGATLVWTAANIALGVRDVRVTTRCETMNSETRALLAGKIGEIRGEQSLVVASRPLLIRHLDILEYDHGLKVPVILGETCPPGGAAPCLVYPRPVNEARECPAAFPFARWQTE